MNKRKHIFYILCFAVFSTILIQWNLTHAILFGGYLQKQEIVYESNDEIYYLSLVNESAKGNLRLGSPFLKEWSGERYIYPAVNVYLVGSVQRIFHLRIKTVMMLFDYLALFFVAALALFLLVSIFQFRILGYLAGGFYLMLPRLFDMWRRPVSPQVNFIPLLIFFIFYFSRIGFWKREIGMAIAAGMLFYTYPYHWTFILALLAVSDAYAFIKAKKILPRFLLKYTVILTVASWYIVNLFSIRHLSYYQETMERIGALASRLPAGYYTQAFVFSLLTLFFLAWIYTRKKNITFSFPYFRGIIAGLFTSLIVLNQQLVTGMQLEFNTHYLPVILLFIVALIAAFFSAFFERYIRYEKIILIIGVFVLLGLIADNIFVRIENNPFVISENSSRHEAFAVYNWFLENDVENAVIYAPDGLAEEIPIYTKNYVSFSNWQHLQLIPTKELIDRFSYFDVANPAITENLLSRQRAIFGMKYVAKMQKDAVIARVTALLNAVPSVSRKLESYIPFDFSALRQKRETVGATKFENYLNRYHVDYLVYREAEKKSVYNNVAGTIVFDNNRYIIKKR